MAGHSKWAQIKHKKAITDAKKAKIFSKVSRIISIAAAEKGPDPQMNAKLRTAIEKAKAVNIPNDNIERAIKKGSGEGKTLSEVTIEAYGPFGTALMIEAITDNKNRTMQEVKNILSDYDGKIANEGSVRWLFDFMGRIEISVPGNDQKQEITETIAIENDAIDIKTEDGKIIILTAPDKLHQTKTALEQDGTSISDSYLDFVPKNYIELNGDEQRDKIEKLYDALDENDDVQEIYSNIN